MEAEAIARLQTKEAGEAIIERIQRDFQLAPVVARTLIEQLRRYEEDYYPQRRHNGQLTYLAVSEACPAGQPLAECRRIAVQLTLHSADDLPALAAGVATLRQVRLLRLTEEAEAQGGLLSHEDLAGLLCSSLATIKRDVQALRQQGLRVPTRGQVKDIGKGVSHKVQIVGDYLAGYTFSEIERHRHHSIGAIRRYCDDFVRIIRLHEQGVSLLAIRSATGLSERLIQEYLILYQHCPAANDRLQILLGAPTTATATPAEIKRGRLMP
jgi:hypothetical protein